MKKIIGVLQPFDLKQNFYVYENGNKIAVGQFKLDEIPEAIFSWSKEYNITQINLMGPKQYSRGLKKKIAEAELAKYNENTLNIDIS